jgi:hypothetical protein
MGEIITNDNISEFLTSYIDGQIKDPDIFKQVKSLIESNDSVFKKYKAELLTRNLFRTRMASVELPSASVTKINNSIDSLIRTASSKHSVNTGDIYSRGFFVYLKKLVSAPVNFGKMGVPRYAFALVLIVILLGAGLLMKKGNTEINPFIASGTEKSVMVQAIKNFKKVLSGDIKPEMKSNDVSKVKSFVKNKAEFDAYVPVISDYELVGVVCNEYHGQKLVHLVYSSGKEIIYIYETQVNSIHCKELELPDPVHYNILRDKYYMCDQVDDEDCTMIVWYKDNVLCTSVSTMPKQRMYASFTSFR